MKCDQIKELLLTDYFDGCLSAEVKNEMDKHISNCPVCAEFKQTVIQTAVVPFQDIERREVPADLWSKIESSLEQNQDSEQKAISWWESLQSLITRPTAGIAFMAVVLLIVSGTLNQWGQQQAKLNKQSKEFLVSVMNAGSSVLISDDDDYGTTVEQIFL